MTLLRMMGVSVAVACIGGCAMLESLRSPSATSGAATTAGAVTTVPVTTRSVAPLDYFTLLRGMSAADVAREVETLRKALADTDTEATRIKLAMALTAPNYPGRDDTQALNALAPLVAANSNGSTYSRQLATLLHSSIRERMEAVASGRRAAESGASQTQQKLRDELKQKQAQIEELELRLGTLESLEKQPVPRSTRAPTKGETR